MSHKNTPGKPLARVLCIDDNCDVLQLEKEILEEAGYEVLLASNGADGLNLATGSMIDIVILDCEMPQMTGTEVAHRIRAMRPMLPIIMVSGAGQPKETKGDRRLLCAKRPRYPRLLYGKSNASCAVGPLRYCFESDLIRSPLPRIPQ